MEYHFSWQQVKNSMVTDDDKLDERYCRQIILPQVGRTGQAKLNQARAVLIGLGATGGSIATALVRAGIGNLTVIDRDFVELSNLCKESTLSFDQVYLKKLTALVEVVHENRVVVHY